MPIDKFGRGIYRYYIDNDVIEKKVEEVVQKKIATLVQQKPPTYYTSILRIWSTNKVKFKANTIQFLLFNFLEKYVCPIDCKIIDISVFESRGVNTPFNFYINNNVFNDIDSLIGVVLSKGDEIAFDFPNPPIIHIQMEFFLELLIEVPMQ